MERNNIFQWDDLYPAKEDFQKDIEKNQLYVGLANNHIVVVYALNQECEKEYENGNWKYKEESFYVVHRLCVNPNFQNNPFATRLYDSLGYLKVGYADWRKGRFFCWKNIFKITFMLPD